MSGKICKAVATFKKDYYTRNISIEVLTYLLIDGGFILTLVVNPAIVAFDQLGVVVVHRIEPRAESDVVDHGVLVALELVLGAVDGRARVPLGVDALLLSETPRAAVYVTPIVNLPFKGEFYRFRIFFFFFFFFLY